MLLVALHANDAQCGTRGAVAVNTTAMHIHEANGSTIRIYCSRIYYNTL